MASEAPITRGIRRLFSSFIGSPAEKPERAIPSSTSTVGMTPEGVSADNNSVVLPPHPETEGEDEDEETVVRENGIRPGTEGVSQKYGFRVRVQEDSIPAHPSEGQFPGPIKVSPLNNTMEEFDGQSGKWKGVLKVECLPSGTRFDAPLLFDFPVDAGTEEDPIMDCHGKIRYEVLVKDRGLKRWVRDPEGPTPLQIVKDGKGQTYVRAQIRHFSIWGFWKREELHLGPQVYAETSIPWSQRRRHKSVIKNITEHDINIHVYAMRMSQWEAALESAKLGAGAEGINAEFEISGEARENIHAIARMPQMMTIPSGNSQWLEIPRVGAGVRSSRKAAVVIVTQEENAEADGRRMRMEAVVHLRSDIMLEVKLPVKDGRVCGSPAAAEPGGILSQVMRVIQNQANATPAAPPSTVGPSRSEGPSETRNPSGASVGSVPGRQPVDGGLRGSSVMVESEADRDSPIAAAAAAAADGGSSVTAAADCVAGGSAAETPSC